MAIVERKLKDGSISFLVRVKKPDGTWHSARSFADRLDAEEEETRLKRMNRALDPGSLRDGYEVSVDEFVEVWAAENRARTSDGWKISQDQMIRDYVSPVIGKKKVAQVTVPMIGRILNRMRNPAEMKDNRARGEETILKVYGLLHKMFGDAVTYYGMIRENPVKPEHHRPETVETEAAFLDPAQSWKLLEAARAHRYRGSTTAGLGPVVWLQLLGGLRREAAIALPWKHVLWDTNQILIARAYKAKVKRIEEYPKGRRWEYVPMAKALREYLWEIWQTVRMPEDFVAPGPKGGMLPVDTYGHALRRLCKAAGVSDVTPHGLRHSCSELFVRVGGSREDIRRLLNHRHESTTGRYMHRTSERLQEFAERIQGPELRVIQGGEQQGSGSFTSVKKTPYVARERHRE